MTVSRSLAWMAASQFLGLSLQFGAQVLIARVLSLHEVGIYAVGVALVGLLSLVQSIGLQALIVREPVLTDEIRTTAFSLNAAISASLGLTILLIGQLGASFLGDPGVGRVVSILALSPVLAIPGFLPGAVLERQGRFKQIAIATSVANIVGALITMTLVLNGFSYMSAAYAQCVNVALQAAGFALLGREHISFKVGFTSWRRVLDFGLQMLAVSGLSTLGSRASDVILGRILGLSALGIYSRASGLNQLIWTNLHLLVGRVMLVDYAEIYRSGTSLRERYIQTVDVLAAFLWPVFAGFAVVSGPFILLVFGERWVGAALPLMFLALASIVLIASTMTYELFAATGQLRIQTRIEFIRSIFSVVMFTIGCTISIEAAAASRVLDALFGFLLYRKHINRMTDTSLRDFIPIYVRNAGFTLVAIAPAALFMSVNSWSAKVSLLTLSATVAAGVGLWIGALALTRHPLLIEARRLIQRR